MVQCWSLLLGLLWSTVFTQAEDAKPDICMPSLSSASVAAYEALPNFTEQCGNHDLEVSFEVSLFVRNCSGQMVHRSQYVLLEDTGESVESLYSGFHLPDGVLHGFLLDISCVLDSQRELNCSWDTAGIPAAAQYSISGLLCNENDGAITSWTCTTYSLGNLTGCQGKTEEYRREHFATVIRVNVSLGGLWYIHTQSFSTYSIEKWDPPKITNLSFKNQSLEIQWERSLSKIFQKRLLKISCFGYEIKINDEVESTHGRLTYLKQNLDRTRKYTVQMRVNLLEKCQVHSWWSDWSEPIEVGLLEEPQPEYSISMIVTISLGLPMILLAFLLLLCKLQRILFPPIPRPCIQVKKLLEKADAAQTVPEKYDEEVSFDCVSEVDTNKP